MDEVFKSIFQAQPRSILLVGAAAQGGRPFLGGKIVAKCYQRWGTELHPILEGHKAIVGAQRVCFRFYTRCIVSKLKSTAVENWDKFRTFDAFVKIRGGIGAFSWLLFRSINFAASVSFRF